MLDACEGRGNGQREAEGLARAGSWKGEVRGWTGRMGVGRGGNGEGERRKRWGSGGRGVGRQRWQWGEGDGEVGNREEATGGNRDGEMGKGDFTVDIMKYLSGHMECLGGM